MKRVFIAGCFLIVFTIVLIVMACAPAATPATTSQASPAPSPITKPAPSPTQTTTPSGVYIPSATLNISAQNSTFDKSTLTIHSRTKVTLVFDNKDSLPHNVAIYTDSSASKVIFRGEVITGPKVVNYEFTAPELPGTYFFRCDVHPNMTGSFIVTQ